MSPTSPISKMSEASPEVGASQLKLRVLKPVYPHPHVVQLPPALKPATLTSCCETWLGAKALLTDRVATCVAEPPGDGIGNLNGIVQPDRVARARHDL